MKHVFKRNKTQVLFDITRIESAIYKAAESVGGKDRDVARELSQKVESYLLEHYSNQVPEVELIQDVVEKILIDEGHAKTAKSYILYRAKRSQMREEKRNQLIKEIGRHEASITKANGEIEKFSVNKIMEGISFYKEGLKQINEYELIKETLSCLYHGITATELDRALINASRTSIEKHEDYSYLAARLLLKPLYKKLLASTPKIGKDQFADSYRAAFKVYVDQGVESKLLDPRLKEFDLDALAERIDPFRDNLFMYRGLQTLYDRYLLRTADHANTVFELPQFLWMRVAIGVAFCEKKDVRVEKAAEFYDLMSNMYYVPSTPTLFNAGTTHPQLSSCFLNTTPDSLHGIFKTYSDNAMLSKYAGGLGTDWTAVRSMGSRIVGTNGSSQGIIPFLKIFNDIAIAVNQGGKRKGAMCAYLEIWHGDVEEFIETKKNTGDDRRRLHDIHTAVWVPDLFMKRVQAKKQWTLFSPNEVPELHDLYGTEFEKKYLEYESMDLPSAKVINAFDLWKKTLTMTFETGHPWITFKDACNVRNPQDHVGVIHNSNLCTEITLNNSSEETAVCNLGSINLSKFVDGGSIMDDRLKSSVRTALRMLDNVIDVNYYPTPETKLANVRHRPIGLGVMGYQDALFKMGINFDSEEHIEFADELMEKISYFALESSSDLASEKGKYSSFEGSKWSRGILPVDTISLLEQERGVPIQCGKTQRMDWDKLRKKIVSQGMRNSNCLAVAPTATISNITGIQPCIEPIFRNIYVKENTDGSFLVVNHYLSAELAERGLWTKDIINKIKMEDGSVQNIPEIPQDIKDKFKIFFEIDQEWVIKAAAARGKWIDQSQSINICLTNSSGKILNNIYLKAWELGLKTTYYLRTLSASQVTKSNQFHNQVETQPTELVKKQVNAQACDITDPTCEACQ